MTQGPSRYEVPPPAPSPASTCRPTTRTPGAGGCGQGRSACRSHPCATVAHRTSSRAPGCGAPAASGRRRRSAARNCTARRGRRCRHRSTVGCTSWPGWRAAGRCSIRSSSRPAHAHLRTCRRDRRAVRRQHPPVHLEHPAGRDGYGAQCGTGHARADLRPHAVPDPAAPLGGRPAGDRRRRAAHRVEPRGRRPVPGGARRAAAAHRGAQADAGSGAGRAGRMRTDAIIYEQATDPNLTPAAIATQLNISLRQLYRAFSGAESPAARIRRRRLERAAEILAARVRARTGRAGRARVRVRIGGVLLARVPPRVRAQPSGLPVGAPRFRNAVTGRHPVSALSSRGAPRG